ncbi:hypothetical protein Tco_0152682 [Tanacetum coccineum]
MVAYLLKPEGSEDFHQIVDFLNTGHIKFALTENPTIYTSLIQQLWQTASSSTHKDGDVEITATIDGQLKTITKESLRRHLKLEDVDGISSLPNSKILEQLDLMGSKFLMYPMFIQILLNKHKRLLLPHKRTYVAPTLTKKLFSNIRRVSKGYTGVNIPLFSNMLVQGPIQQGEGSTVPVESHHIPITTPSTSQPPLSSPSKVPTPPHDSPLPGGHILGSDEGSMTLTKLMVLCTQLSTKVESLEQDLMQTKKVYSNAYTKLIMRMKKLEHKVKSRQPRRRGIVVISDTEEDLEDPSKQGRRIAKIYQNPSISSVQDKGTSWIQEDTGIQGRTSADTEILLDQEESTELVGDIGSGERGEKEISTANISVSTASATPNVSTTSENLVYIRRNAEKRKDKGKAIMKEDESINEEERQRIVRDAEIAKQLQEEFNRVRQEQEVVAKADQAHDIDWSDPAVLRYHAVQNISFSKAEDSEIEKEVMKRTGFDFQQKSSKKRSRNDSDEDNAKKQKLEDGAKKKELRDSIDVVLRDDIVIDVESLATKYPIVNWKTHVLIENMMYYQINKGDESSKNYKIFSEMLDDFDRQDVMDLHRLVQERLFDSCGIHMLLMHTGLAIHMMIEKKYPLTQEMLSRMLSRRLEVDEESEMAFELLRFVKSQL